MTTTGESRKIRVMQLVERSSATVTGGGAERVAADLATTLDPAVFRSYMGVVSRLADTPNIPDTGAEVILLPGGGSFSLAAVRALARIVKKHNIDIVHSHLARLNTYNWLASILARHTCVGSIHGYDIITGNVSPRARMVARMAANGSDRTIAVSEHLRRDLIDRLRIKPSKLMTIHNGFDTARVNRSVNDKEIAEFRRNYECPEGIPIIVAVGHLRREKGYRYLLEAVSGLSASVNVRLVIAGLDIDGEQAALEREMAKLNPVPPVCFLGEFQDIALLFSVGNVYVSSSLHEGFSITTVEAMAAGLPVVVTDSGGPAEIVAPDQTGLVVPVADPEAMTQALKRLLTDAPLAERFGRLGRERAGECFSMKQFTAGHENLYRELVASSRRFPER